jgi:uncharacterized protein (TIGR02598 family)
MGLSSPSPLLHRRSSAAGFTLVEVALAIGIVAFAFVALLALLPAGQHAFRQSIDVAVCGQIAQRIINEAQMSDFQSLIDATKISKESTENFTFRAPMVTKPGFRYFDDQGRELSMKTDTPSAEEQRKVVYQVNTRIMPRATLPANRTVRISNDNGNSKIPPQPLAQITVQVAINPGGVKIPLSSAAADGVEPMRNLWVSSKDTAGIQIYTYSTLVGRNE